MKKFNIVLAILIFIGATDLLAQTFLKPMKDLNFRQAAAVTTDSSVFAGTMSGASMVMGYLNGLRIKDENGEVLKANRENTIRIDVVHKTKLERETLFENGEMAQLKQSVKGSDIAGALGMLMSKGSELQSMLQAKPQYNNLTFERVEMPGKKKKYKFLQLLNPGFDSRIKAYFKYSGEGEDAAKKYYLVKDGGQFFDIKKNDYRDVFNALYSDCPKMKSLFPNGGSNYSNISVHIYTYDQLCGGM